MSSADGSLRTTKGAINNSTVLYPPRTGQLVARSSSEETRYPGGLQDGGIADSRLTERWTAKERSRGLVLRVAVSQVLVLKEAPAVPSPPLKASSYTLPSSFI